MTITQCMGCNAASVFSRRLVTGPRAGDFRPSRWSAGASVQVAAVTVTQCMVCNGGGSFHRGATAGLPGSVRRSVVPQCAIK